MQTTTRTVLEDIAIVTERIDALNASLATCPTYKKKTLWFVLRIAERRSLLAQLDRLKAEAREARG